MIYVILINDISGTQLAQSIYQALGQHTWVAGIMHDACQDHGQHLQVSQLRHKAVLRKHAGEALHHIRGMRAVVVRVAPPVCRLNLLQRTRLICIGLCRSPD